MNLERVLCSFYVNIVLLVFLTLFWYFYSRDPKFSFARDQKFTSPLVQHFRCTRKTDPTLQFTQQTICTAESGFSRPENIFIYLTVTYLYPVVNCKYKNAHSCKHAVLLTLSPLDVHLNQNHHVHNALLHRPIIDQFFQCGTNVFLISHKIEPR